MPQHGKENGKEPIKLKSPSTIDCHSNNQSVSAILSQTTRARAGDGGRLTTFENDGRVSDVLLSFLSHVKDGTIFTRAQHVLLTHDKISEWARVDREKEREREDTPDVENLDIFDIESIISQRPSHKPLK